MTTPSACPAPVARPKRVPLPICALAGALAVALAAAGAAPLAAQQTFSLPPPTPAPTTAPAGPADERAGVAIPPRAQPTAQPAEPPVAEPIPAPQVQPLPAPSATLPPRAPAPSPAPAPAPSLSPAPQPGTDAAAPQPDALPAPDAAAATPPPALPGDPAMPNGASDGAGNVTDAASAAPLPEWWPLAAGGLGVLALMGAGAALWRRRRPRTLRLAAPAAGASAGTGASPAPPRLDLALEITSATRSVMMFTVEYRLSIANRSDRAVNDLNAAAKLACARGGAGTPAGAAQGLETIARIGPQQARSITGTLQLPLSAIAPMRQGQTPLFIPLVHVTLEGESLPADTRTFVIGTPSASGRVHPIPLDQPPGRIAGLVAQAVAVPASPAAAAA